METTDFLKKIRKHFDPCFRYMVLTRKWSGKADSAFSDVYPLIDKEASAVVGRSIHRDPASGALALVLKLLPHEPSAIVSALVGGRLPEDISFYVYESHDRACEDPSDRRAGTDGDRRS